MFWKSNVHRWWLVDQLELLDSLHMTNFQATIYASYFFSSLRETLALAGWLSWMECHPVHRKVVGLIPSQDTHVGFRFDTRSGYIQEAINQSFSLSLKSINISSGED